MTLITISIISDMAYSTLKAAIQAVIKQNGNNEITGPILQQALLSMINSLGDGYQFKGVATPATNPGTPDQNVFYIASEVGTYSNFGLSVGENEVAVFLWNGSWSKQSTGAASVEAVNQLGQQVIYDVSANNDGATFASLSALLSSNNLSTLIPIAVRCGGMSIRFVQTSDNKYVQYRYMGTETTGTPNPFLDTANWQGADDEPTAGSDNLVKSGGVYTFLPKQVLYTPYPAYTLGNISNSGVVHPEATSYGTVAPVELKKGETLFVNYGSNVYYGENVAVLFRCNNNGDFIETIIDGGYSYAQLPVVYTNTSESTLYVGFCAYPSQLKYYIQSITEAASSNEVNTLILNKYCRDLSIVGKGTTNNSLKFDVEIGNKYVIEFPETWSIPSMSSSVVVFELKAITNNSAISIIAIDVDSFDNKPSYIEFTAEYKTYEIFVKATTSEQLLFALKNIDAISCDNQLSFESKDPVSNDAIFLELLKKPDVEVIDGVSIASVLSTSYVPYENGTISTVSVSSVYKINLNGLSGASKIYVNAGYVNNKAAIIAFYTGEPSASTYIQASSVKVNRFLNKYTANIPSNAKYICITNASSKVANPVITIFVNSYAIKEYTNLYPVKENPALFNHVGALNLNGTELIPCQSLFDVRFSKDYGFKAIELNVIQTGDGIWICRHGNGNAGKKMTGLIDNNGDDTVVEDISAITYASLKENYRYKSPLPAFRTYIPTLEEILVECKRYDITPMVRPIGNVTEIVRKYVGEGFIALMYPYDGSQRPANLKNNTILRSTSGESYTLAQHKQYIDAFGSPFIESIDANNLSDAELKELLQYANERNCGIALGGAYSTEKVNQHAIDLGVDMMGSGWNVPVFEECNLYNLCGNSIKGYSEYTINGGNYDSEGVLVLNSGDSISFTGSEILLAKGLIDIIVEGEIQVLFGRHIRNAEFTESNIKERIFTSILERENAGFTITASSDNTKIFSINFKVNKIM